MSEDRTKRMTGKWAEAGVPHKGWSCVGFEDLGEPAQLCEMCDSQEIRYVHYMEHPNFPTQLGCGCICAGHMEEDYQAAEYREKSAKNANRRRINWLKRKWRISAKRNEFIRTDNCVITIFPRKSDFSFSIIDNISKKKGFSRRSYDSVEKAKLAAFDAMIWMKNQR